MRVDMCVFLWPKDTNFSLFQKVKKKKISRRRRQDFDNIVVIITQINF
jgi:hypothetical protein